jgi:hypothetical protein
MHCLYNIAVRPRRRLKSLKSQLEPRLSCSPCVRFLGLCYITLLDHLFVFLSVNSLSLAPT